MVNLYQPNTLRILGSRLSLSLSLSRNSSTRQLHHRSFPSSISPSPLQLSPLPSIIIRTMSSAQNPNPEPGTSNNNSQEATAAAAATEPHKTPLPLPEPTHASDNNVTQLPVDGEGVRLDHRKYLPPLPCPIYIPTLDSTCHMLPSPYPSLHP